MLKYKDYNDFELLDLISEQHEQAYDILYNKYYPIIKIKASKYLKYGRKKGLEQGDLIQEGTIGFNEAIRDFNNNKGVKFITFANLCIERQINGAVLAANRQKHKILNDSISLENTFIVKKPLMYFLADQKQKDPSNYIIELEKEKELNLIIKQLLTPLEQQVFKLKLRDFSYKEIANILGKSYKSVDSTIQRIKNKLKKKFNL